METKETVFSRAVAGWDLSDDAVQWYGTGLSCLFFVLVYVATQVLSQCSTLYCKLTSRQRVFWNLALVRSVFGLFGTFVGCYWMFYDDSLSKDVVNAKTDESHVCVMIITGFFVFECAALFLSNMCNGFFDANLALHHLLAVVGHLMVVYYDTNHYFVGAAVLLEVTTPFTAVCWVLIKAGRENSLLWKANQMLLVHLFHVRISIGMLVMLATFKNLGLVLADMPLPLLVLHFVGLVLTTFYLTPFWTYKKTCQLFNPVDWNHEPTTADKQKTT